MASVTVSPEEFKFVFFDGARISAVTEKLLGEIPGLGGQVLNGPVRMPQGTIAVLRDPQGAVFAVWSGEYEE